MKGNKNIFTFFQRISACFMIVALLWLTVSAPFVFSAQKELAKQEKSSTTGSPLSGSEEETTNPLGSASEEKSPTSNNSFSEEYLHDQQVADHFFSINLEYHKCENAGTYVAYHGELLVPPPNIS
jgi:hypothetical protein